VQTAGGRPTPIIDRQYFHSVYFREPSGVLFELASRDIGFAVDEPAETLGEALKLPPRYEARREELERRLTPLVNPRAPVAS
jgi:glyoxalase family protein